MAKNIHCQAILEGTCRISEIPVDFQHDSFEFEVVLNDAPCAFDFLLSKEKKAEKLLPSRVTADLVNPGQFVSRVTSYCQTRLSAFSCKTLRLAVLVQLSSSC